MIITTTPNIEGKTIVEYKGLVFGFIAVLFVFVIVLSVGMTISSSSVCPSSNANTLTAGDITINSINNTNNILTFFYIFLLF